MNSIVKVRFQKNEMSCDTAGAIAWVLNSAKTHFFEELRAFSEF